ncbi:hypothetical protein GE300_13400 [Rhodobacteraceae bacterium 2CG4]|uniref:Uncharacterized protein n=1 Tax=Halovulum marinum TaxID=2662447 RepID=A0A6L5Z2U8_9RHOB|nr:hypothetical protein [Halovulum marinum]MSU90599.1 hypothetical protein [Halovulum marinum]
MFDHITTFTAPPCALDDLRAYLSDHRDALLDSAALLGDQPGVRLAQSVLDGFDTPGTPTRRTMRALDDLLDLLMLENVHDPDRIEAARFAMIDPANPIVEEVCLLADDLDDMLEAYRAVKNGGAATFVHEVAA